MRYVFVAIFALSMTKIILPIAQIRPWEFEAHVPSRIAMLAGFPLPVALTVGTFNMCHYLDDGMPARQARFLRRFLEHRKRVVIEIWQRPDGSDLSERYLLVAKGELNRDGVIEKCGTYGDGCMFKCKFQSHDVSPTRILYEELRNRWRPEPVISL